MADALSTLPDFRVVYRDSVAMVSGQSKLKLSLPHEHHRHLIFVDLAKAGIEVQRSSRAHPCRRSRTRPLRHSGKDRSCMTIRR